ncbi:Locomotion-related protein Hikaru genki [Amphibalanus amphitrite]|uniref:Locomotion-related protein Hikaru genki n=1 Tax=Amphibalanus amphitrite TaxID=1232801 RepID=A0A6A4VIE5_AMPAM|nr:Locomotion-related protein Hikaru genki [Amphibalanus amphitrite]
MIDTLVGYVEASPQLTLKEIANKLREETGVQLSTNTVHKHLSGRMYTVKKVLPEPWCGGVAVFQSAGLFHHGTRLTARCQEVGMFRQLGGSSLLCVDGRWNPPQPPVCQPTTVLTNFSHSAPFHRFHPQDSQILLLHAAIPCSGLDGQLYPMRE